MQSSCTHSPPCDSPHSPSTTERLPKPHRTLPLESCGKRNAALGQCLDLNQKQSTPTCSIETWINTFLKMQKVHPKDAPSMLWTAGHHCKLSKAMLGQAPGFWPSSSREPRAAMRKLCSSTTRALPERGAGQAADSWGLKKVPPEPPWSQVLVGTGRLHCAYLKKKLQKKRHSKLSFLVYKLSAWPWQLSSWNFRSL